METCSVLGANYMTTIARIVLGIINTLTSCSATFGNLLIIIVIFHYKSLRRRSNYLIICLAVTDLAVGIILQPMASIQVFKESAGKDCYLAYAVTYLGAMLCGASSWILALISYDRYLHLVKLQNYNAHMSKTKWTTLVSLCWIFPVCLGCLLFSDATIDAYYGILVLSANFNVLIIILCYRSSWKFIKEKSKVFPRGASLSQAQKQETVKIHHHWKVAKTFALIIACYLICWTPMVVFVVYLLVVRKANLSFGGFEPYVYTVYYVTLLMGYSNSTLNPLIYFWRNRELKAAMKQFVLHVILKRRIVPEENLGASTQTSNS